MQPLSSDAAPATEVGASSRPAARFIALLEHPRLGLLLAVLAVLLSLPPVFTGFALDDYFHRYMLSDLPGAAALLHAYQSPFGIANGDPATNHWQIEAGYAPWWTYPHLLISLWRPVSELTHRVDAALFPDNALLQHLHNLAWLFALVLAVTALYRGVLGRNTVAGVAAAMYALDHTHGFAIGWIANRNALVAATFGVLALHAHVQARTRASPARLWLSAGLLLLALLSGEGAIAIFAYILGYALFVERDPFLVRARSLAPAALVFAGWRTAYSALGRGARFSGLYVDPAHAPLAFARAVIERAPWLGLGQLALPPAEAAVFAPESTRAGLYALCVVACALAALACWPLVRANRNARFFGFGALASLCVACTTHPNNRLLFFAGLGVMPLISELWHGALHEAAFLPARRAYRALVHGFAAVAAAFRLFVSPLLLPLAALSIVLTLPAANAARAALAGSGGRELVIVGAPDYFYVKLVPVLAALEHRPAPSRVRALSFGAVPLQVSRPDARTLDVRFEGGLLREPLLELYRARDLVMAKGTRVVLHGMSVEVTALTNDQRIAAARFRFDAPLEDPRYRFLTWDGARYVPFVPPAVSRSTAVPAASLHLGLVRFDAPASRPER